jgi:hypothetical protein
MSNRARESPHVLPIVPEEHVWEYDVFAELHLIARTEDNDFAAPVTQSRYHFVYEELHLSVGFQVIERGTVEVEV